MSLPWSSKGLKATPVDADELMIIDSADPTPSTKNKRITIGSLPSTETLTWTADHDANGFDLLNVGGITISNPADTFQYIVTPDAIAADRILNLPLLTGTDTFVTAAFAQTLTNKILGNTNSIAADAIDSATLADARLSTNVMLLATAQENTAAKQFRDDTLEFRNIANTFDYHVRTSAITIDRDITLPLLTGNDTFVFASFAQTLTNKTLTTPTIASFTNAGHNHQNATGGGTLLSTSALSDTANIAYLNTANSYTAGSKQSFVASGTTAGLNINAQLPSGLAIGDIYRTAEILHFIGTSATDYTLVSNGQSTTYTAGTRQDFLGLLAGTAGLNVGGIAGNPTTQVDGDLWLNTSSNQLFARINGANVDIGGAGGGEVFTWTADHSMATFKLTATAANDVILNAPTSQGVSIEVAASQEYDFDAAQANFLSNNIINLGTLNTHTIPGGTDTLALLAATQTLTNKTLGTGTIFSVIPTINDGITFTFNPNATVSGINVGAHTTNPSSQVDGNIWYNSTSNTLFGRINGINTDLGAAGGSSPPFSDSTSIVEGSIDPTKEIRFEVDGLTTATTRVITPPDADITLVSTSDGLINNANVGAAAAIATTKLADSANFVLTNQANTFGDFAQTFADNQLFIQNPAATFEYQISAAGIAADRTITLPLLTGNDIMVTADFIQTLTNKTLTEPIFADLGFIADANGNEMIAFDTVTTAVNYAQLANSATGNQLTLSALGTDTDIDFRFVPKGTGTFYGVRETFAWPLTDETTAPTTGVKYTTEPAPYDMTIEDAIAGLTTAGTGAALFTIDVLKENSVNANAFTTIFTTKPTIDASEFTSTTAATAQSLSVTTWEKGRRLQLSIDTLDTDLVARGAKIELLVHTTAK